MSNNYEIDENNMTKEVIASAGNVEVPAYLALCRLGYDVVCERDESGAETWSAVRSDIKLVGDGLLELLGLHELLQQRGQDWKADDAEINKFLHRYYPDQVGGL